MKQDGSIVETFCADDGVPCVTSRSRRQVWRASPPPPSRRKATQTGRSGCCTVLPQAAQPTRWRGLSPTAFPSAWDSRFSSKPSRGAGGNLAADAVARSAPDGYTIGLVTGAHAISGALYKQLAYSPVDSFDMLSTMVHSDAPVIAVRADHQAKTLADLIAMAKAKPDGLSYGSVGFGSTHHLAGELLNVTAGTKMVHIPYRGDSLTVTSLLAGDVRWSSGPPCCSRARSKAAPFAGSRSPRPHAPSCCRTCRPRRRLVSRDSTFALGR